MDRISTATKAVDLYGAGKHGFKDGNLGLGIAPTDFAAAWCNGVQEELLAVIEAAALSPASGTLNQVLLALRAMYGTARVGHTFTASDWIEIGGGVILQWGQSPPNVANGTTFTFPVTFPNSMFQVIAGYDLVGSGQITLGINGLAAGGGTYYVSGTNPGTYVIRWFAIGRK